MNIKHPELLFLLLLIPVIIGFYYWVWKRRGNVLAKLCSRAILNKLFPKNSKLSILIRFCLLILAFSMFVISLISPRWGYDWKEVETFGSNIFIALDVSKSMLADDISPNRLSRAKLELNQLLEKLQGDRVGLIIFSGEAFLQSPLTHDYLMLAEWLAKTDVDSISSTGTSIKEAIKIAIRGFSHINSNSKVLIIVSDGEEQDEGSLDLAKEAASKGIKIYTIGIGSSKGAPISYHEELIKDKNGTVVVSKLNDELLKEISKLSGGEYIRSSSGDFHINKLYYEYIKNQNPNEKLKSGKTKIWMETYQIFLAIVLISLILELLLSFNLGIFDFLKRKVLKKNSLLGILLCTVSCINLNAKANILDWRLHSADFELQNAKYSQAKEKYLLVQVDEPSNPRLAYNLSICDYKSGNFSGAINDLSQALLNSKSMSDIFKAKATYNMGNSFFMSEKYQEAIDAYKKSLEIDPENPDTKYNLELAKKLLELEKQENKDTNSDNQNKKDPNQKNQNDKKQDQKDQSPEQNPPENEENPEDQWDKKSLENMLKQVEEGNPAKYQVKPISLGKKKQLNDW
jgi:Ca-activated chloride channel homolog